MSQIFHPSTNTLSRFTIFGAVFVIAVLIWIAVVLSQSQYLTQVAVVRHQPIEFSHEHHVGGLGIDCRFCHTSVEQSRFANVPPTETCMQCHNQIWANSPKLAPVRESWRTGQPIHWTRVNNVPDFVQFNHAIHVQKGFACVTCHGRVDRMPLTWRTETLHMKWCLDCHRHPEQYIQPRETVFQLDWQPPEDDPDIRARLVKEYEVARLTNCSVCHY